jgi:hypothetical protein
MVVRSMPVISILLAWDRSRGVVLIGRAPVGYAG